MKLLVLSDLHLEFYGDTGASFLKYTPWPDHNACVIAGDLSNAKKLSRPSRPEVYWPASWCYFSYLD